MAHSRVARVGSTPGGTVVRASEKVPRPVQLSRPRKTRAPMPEASSPGRATRLSVAPAMPAASMMRNAPSSGEPSRVLTAAKLPAEAMTVSAIGVASFLTSRTVSGREAGADGDERCLGAEHRAQAQGRERRQDDAGQVPVDRRPATDRKPRAGECPPGPGQVPDGQRHEQPAEHQPRHRPPRRARSRRRGRWAGRRTGTSCSAPDEGEEAVGDRGDRDPEQRREHQRREVGPGADDAHRVEGGWGAGGRGRVGHLGLPPRDAPHRGPGRVRPRYRRASGGHPPFAGERLRAVAGRPRPGDRSVKGRRHHVPAASLA